MSTAHPRAVETDLADGEWHRLHPATPLLKGGIGVIVVLGIVISNLRERLLEIFLPDARRYGSEDPVDAILDGGLLGWALLALAVILIVAVGGFYLSWRMHTFRVTDEVVEVRSGIVFRTHRRARLDRIQGINVSRPLFARLFGTSKLEVGVAGQDANVQLAYLGATLADALRRDILRIASGVVAPGAAAPADGATPVDGVVPVDGVPVDGVPADGVPVADGSAPATQQMQENSLISRRVGEFQADFAEPGPPESVVKIHLGRLIGSLVFSGFTIFLLIAIAAVVAVSIWGSPWILFSILPGVIGSASYYARRFVRMLRYSIAGTPDGVRVGYGVLSTSSDTIPPGRVHAVEVVQPLLWRPFGWWEVRINRAGTSATKAASGEANTTILPVGDLADVQRVLGLLLPGFLTEETAAVVERGVHSKGLDEFSAPPKKAAFLRPFSWRRTGYLLSGEIALLRQGAVWRTLALVPLARLQSVRIEQGPLQRALGLASGRLHTVTGPVSSRLGSASSAQAVEFFETVSVRAAEAAANDTSHRWGGPHE